MVAEWLEQQSSLHWLIFLSNCSFSYNGVNVLDTKEQSLRAINYTLSALKCLSEEIYSTVQKGHKTKLE